MQIDFKVIPHEDQRYETAGDYFEDDSGTHFRVSDMGNEDYSFAVFIHELIEWYLYKKTGKSVDEIDAFDKKFEEMREKYPELVGNDEPGDNINAPYYAQHQLASQFERNIIGMMGLDWQEYSNAVESL